MNIGQNLFQKQTQQLKQHLSPKMIQMLGTFGLSYSDLVDTIKKESQDNVFVEITKFDELHQYSKSNQSQSFMGQDISDFAADTSDKTMDIYTFVVKQIDLLHLPKRDILILQHLCESLDSRGYIQNYAEVRKDLAKQFGVQERKINSILTILQSLDPDGVGARDLKECLLIQVDNHDFSSDALKDVLSRLITHHLDDLSEEKFETIAKKLKIEIDGVRSLAGFIRDNLNPNPGIAFSTTAFNQHIIPSFEVHLEGNQLVVTNLEEKHGINISISKKYLQLLDDPATDKETKAFLKTKLEAAQTLQENIQKRIDMLNSLSSYVCNKQIAFIQHGDAFIEPLLQKDIAQILDITPSTVSRSVSSKFIITPHGTYSLKQLCPRSHFGKTSERLKNIVQELASKYPGFSDEKLMRILNVDFDIPLARRTVAKYRALTETGSSYTRNI
jgi:RNA polymerase sigma-54 factor